MWKELKDDYSKYLHINNNPFDAVCVTTNKVVKNNGELVMGAGIAKLAKLAYPSLPRVWGERIKKIPENINIICSNVDYYLDNKDICKKTFARITNLKPLYLLSFCTKNDWKDKSSLTLIKKSMEELYTLIYQMGWNNTLLPKPGCFNGQLSWESEVLPAIEPHLIDLGDRITIISKG